MDNPAIKVLTRYRTEYSAVKAAHDQMVADCAATKTTPPANYWQIEHEAKRKMLIAQEVAIAIQDEIDGGL